MTDYPLIRIYDICSIDQSSTLKFFGCQVYLSAKTIDTTITTKYNPSKDIVMIQ